MSGGTPVAESNAVLSLEELQRHRGIFTRALKAPTTQRGYKYDFAAFQHWAESMHLAALPASPETLTLYVVSRLATGRKVSTVKRNVASIATAHRVTGHVSPFSDAVRDVLRGAKRLRVEQVRQVRPLTLEDLREIAAMLAADGTAIAKRNKAIILVGFCSALRSANLVALRLEDVVFSEQGCTLNIRQSKTDQEGKGRLIGLPIGKHPETCPVTALRDWIAWRGAYPGELFTRFDGHRNKGAIQPERCCQIVQNCLKRIGRQDWKDYGSHSMRSGLVTEAGDAGAGEYLLASQTGHRDFSILRKYFRRRDVFRNNVCGLLDL